MLRNLLRAKPQQDPPEDLGLTGTGVERVKIAAIDTAYRQYRPHKEAFVEATRKHNDARAKLLEKMDENWAKLPKDEAGAAFYITNDDYRITVEKKEKLSIDKEESED